MGNFKKLVGTILGGVSGGVIVALLSAFGVTIPLALGVVIAGAVSAIGTYLAPPNDPTGL
jgi:hypothetical protein